MKLCEPARSVGAFIDKISEVRDTWGVKPSKELWFRGEKRDYGETKLRPGLYRPEDNKALKSPLDLLDIEDDLFAHFRHCSTELARAESSAEETSDPWVEYFQMQHHLAQTRLLDWTDGALIALHFAVRSDSLRQVSKDDVPRVYVLDPYWLMDHIRVETKDHEAARQAWINYCRKYPTKQNDEDDWDGCYLPDQDGHEELPVPKFPLVLEFDHFTRRVAAQRSRFIVMGTAADFFNQLLTRVDVRIETIPIDPGHLSEMRVELRDAGISESAIFPDLDGLGREIRQLWAERLVELS